MPRTGQSASLDDAFDTLETVLNHGIKTLASSLGDATPRIKSSARNAAGFASAHPWIAALIGAGVAGLALALSRTPSKEPKVESLMEWENEGGSPVDVGDLEDVSEEWMDRAISARDTAVAKLQKLISSGQATARARASVAAEMAADIGEALRHDLDDLNEAASERAVAARARAWDMLEAGQSKAKDRIEQAKENPAALAIAGAAAAAVVAAMMPRTRAALKPVLSYSASAALSALAAEGVGRMARETQTSAKIKKAEKRLRKKADRMVDDLVANAESGREQLVNRLAKATNRARAAVTQ